MFSLTKSVMSRMFPFVTASPMCWESRIATSKSVCRAANCVNMASCQLALGTVFTSMLTFGRSLVYSAFAKSSSAWAGGHSNQMNFRVSGSSVSSGTLAGALGPLASASPPQPLSSPPPQAARAVAITMAAAANRTGRPGRVRRPALMFRICSPASCFLDRVVAGRSRGSCWVLLAVLLPGRRDVLGLHELEESFRAPLPTEAALLGAAEGRGGIRDQTAVEADHAALDAFRQAEAASEVAGVEVAHQAECRVVHQGQHL